MARAKKEAALTPEERLQAALVPDWEWPYKLPENWCWTNWGECGEFVAGSGFKNEYQGFTNYDIPFYKVSSLKTANETGYLCDNTNTVDETVRKKLKAALIPANSLLFAKIGEAIRLNRRAINTVPCCVDNNMMAFIPIICQLKYAFYWSKGIDLYDFTNATTVPAIRKTDLEKISFPLAPLAEQQRIVDRIESLFTKLDEAKEKAQAVVDSFETRKAAILHKAFTGELTVKWREEHGVSIDNWKTTRFDSVAAIRSNLVDPAEYQSFPHIAPDNIEKKTGVLLEYHTIAEDGVTSGKHRFYSGQILYSKIRPYGYLEHIGIELIKKDGTTFSSLRLSEGEKQLGLLMLLTSFTARHECLYLFDEFDAYLHLNWQRQFASNIANTDIFGHILFTTHSPASISKVKMDDLFIMKDGKAIYPESETYNRALNEIMFEQMDVTMHDPEVEELYDQFKECIATHNKRTAEEIQQQLVERLRPEDPLLLKLRIMLRRL